MTYSIAGCDSSMKWCTIKYIIPEMEAITMNGMLYKIKVPKIEIFHKCIGGKKTMMHITSSPYSITLVHSYPPRVSSAFHQVFRIQINIVF